MEQTQKRSEYRSGIKLETRVEEKQEGGKKLVLRGYPILFNNETTIFDGWYGEVRETILPTALDGTDLSDVYLVNGHNIEPTKVLARSGRNMRLEIDETGLFFECVLPNTQEARDTYNLIEEGIIDGMSFGFTCSDMINTETMTRTITHIDELFEITITPFPAYKEASVIVKNQAEPTVPNDEETKAEEAKQEEAQAIAEDIAEKEEELKKLEKELEDIVDGE